MKKGDKVVIKNNSILDCMGLPTATGTVLTVYPDGHGFAFSCDQTGSMETCDFGDGEITIQ